MAVEYVNEMFRSESGSFYKNFADYLLHKGEDHWNVKNCTFFDNEKKNRRWAWCLFERKA